ncbi:shikimate dehydrogenase [Laspinema olomoucense]|uniref:Shikimate dehydrogenase (NADP(+)) n=1 Tax=Laspinema olomoucense D3b TaxID=2953688 RepID=A0ABT2N3U3_9CYAN|nr:MULTISPECIES: shikimate dehydrogenase [unclassified Laspinema]MCT7971969.1 shikimate dehydrogenase [Laspinema sp. D3d]MCT7976440.1 shikimate dehydrogenase [Laspinema sp. D3b]MCT7990018.1 shikimate dehydrogenase [Laspinema sp. D3a]MCT7994574.1 shikimate dehydrogenase [Laspinema sp. D3c]
MPTITGTTQLLGVIGYPVKHSLSPVMHNAAIAEMGVDFVYLPWPVAPANLSTAIAGFAAIGVRGFSITIPHKQAIIPLLSEISPVAQAVGAVNTVWRTPTGWAGTNTDVEGFLAPLQSCDRPWNQTLAVILGAGGAARAVVAGLAQLGCAQICVVGRNLDKLQAFQTSWQDSPWLVNLSVHDWSELPQLIPQAGLLVNSTPVGMYPDVGHSPVTPDLLGTLPQGAIAYDLIYTPSPTEFLRQAQAVGAEAIDGSEMLVQQGAAALQIWLDRPVPVDIMGQALRQHLRG